MGRVGSMQEMDAIAVANRDGRTITIGDLGRAEDSTEEVKSASLYNDTPCVLLNIRKQSGTNTVEVASLLKERLESNCGKLAPKGYRVEVVRDQSVFIEAAVDTVKEHLMLGGVLAAVVVFFFLANIRATVIAALSIPTSIIAAFAIVHYMGFTLNSITLLALDALGGHRDRRRDRGDGEHLPLHRGEEVFALRGRDGGHRRNRPGGDGHHALAGRRVPADRHDGRHRRPVPQVVRHHDGGHDPGEHVGQLHAHADAGGPLVQGPGRRRQGRRRGRHGDGASRRGANRSRRARSSIASSSRSTWSLLRFSLRHRWIVVLAVVGCMATLPMLFGMVHKNFMPDDDSSEFQVSVQAPEGTSLEATQVLIARIARDIRQLDGVRYTIASVADTEQRNPYQGTIYVRLVNIADRDYGQLEIMDFVRKNDPAEVSRPTTCGSASRPVSLMSGGGMSRRRRPVHDRRPRHPEARSNTPRP